MNGTYRRDRLLIPLLLLLTSWLLSAYVNANLLPDIYVCAKRADPEVCPTRYFALYQASVEDGVAPGWIPASNEVAIDLWKPTQWIEKTATPPSCWQVNIQDCREKAYLEIQQLSTNIGQDYFLSAFQSQSGREYFYRCPVDDILVSSSGTEGSATPFASHRPLTRKLLIACLTCYFGGPAVLALLGAVYLTGWILWGLVQDVGVNPGDRPAHGEYGASDDEN